MPDRPTQHRHRPMPIHVKNAKISRPMNWSITTLHSKNSENMCRLETETVQTVSRVRRLCWRQTQLSLAVSLCYMVVTVTTHTNKLTIFRHTHHSETSCCSRRVFIFSGSSLSGSNSESIWFGWMTAETNIFEVSKVKVGRRSNKLCAFLQDERWHPNLKRDWEWRSRLSSFRLSLVKYYSKQSRQQLYGLKSTEQVAAASAPAVLAPPPRLMILSSGRITI